MRLLNKTPLTIYRKGDSTGYSDEDGKWVESSTEEQIPIKCSVQPFRNGDEGLVLPDGVKSSDAVFIYTKTPLQTSDDRSVREGDQTILDGVRYECFNVANWSRYGLKVDHYKTIFIKKDKL